jgi:hypothetical protein
MVAGDEAYGSNVGTPKDAPLLDGTVEVVIGADVDPGTVDPKVLVGTIGGAGVSVVAGIPPLGGTVEDVPGIVGKPPVGMEVELGMGGF